MVHCQAKAIIGALELGFADLRCDTCLNLTALDGMLISSLLC